MTKIWMTLKKMCLNRIHQVKMISSELSDLKIEMILKHLKLLQLLPLITDKSIHHIPNLIKESLIRSKTNKNGWLSALFQNHGSKKRTSSSDYTYRPISHYA